MTRSVIIYARYSTDRQDEQSIETQIGLCHTLVADRGFKLVDTFQDSAISGTSYKRRPGIQALLRRVRQGGVDTVLCISTDRLSRDVGHTAEIAKTFDFRGVEFWTTDKGGRIDNLELNLRAILSQEMIAQGRTRTREGMKTTVRNGRAAGGLAYGYRVKHSYDERGDRIPGLREINEAEAEIVRWIFSEYAKGRSPSDLAFDLNRRDPQVPGPRGKLWRDTAIRGSGPRGTGILNNESYVGRVVWNRQEYRKDPDTEKRVPRHNGSGDWVIADRQDLRIVSDELWAAVKRKQAEVKEAANQPTTNKLNKAHRPQYLLSGILECAHCHGPFAKSSRTSYSCTNRRLKLPIAHLDGMICTNSQTINRVELEERVIAAIPDRLLGADNLDAVNRRMATGLKANAVEASAEPRRLQGEIDVIGRKQRALAEKITERIVAGHPAIPQMDQMLDELETQRLKLMNDLERLPPVPKQITASVQPISHSMLALAISALKTARLVHQPGGTNEQWTDFLRGIIQKVVIGPPDIGEAASTNEGFGMDPPRGKQPKRAALTIHGHLPAIIAAHEAWTEASRALGEQHSAEYARKLAAGQFKTAAQKLKFVERCKAIQAEREKEWMLVQMSVVAGAGFEPAAFRL